MSENGNKKNDDVYFSEIEDKYTIEPDVSEAQKQDFVYSENAEKVPAPKGYSIASMVLGIASIVCCCCVGYIPFVFIAPLLFGIAALVLRSVAKKKGAKDGMMTAGLICGISGIALALIGLIYTCLFLIGVLSETEDIYGTTLIL